MKRWQHLWRLLPVALMMLALTGCGKPFLSALDPKGEVAEMQFSLMALSLYIMIGVFVVVIIIYTFVLFRFRQRPGQENIIPDQVEGSHKLELIWTVIPIVLLIVLAIPTVQQTFVLDDLKSAPGNEGKQTVEITVKAHQFWWEFEYPGLGVKTAQEAVIPTGANIKFDLTSVDVLHAFWVPSLGGKQDNAVASSNHLWLTADETGTYEGRCTELCGASHALMNFKVKAVPPADFDNWVASMNAPVYEDVSTAGQDVFNQNCLACHAVGTEGGVIGPNLTNFGDRDVIAGYLEKSDENLERWIRTPHKVKEGALMPGFAKLEDQDMAALLEYLNGLKVQ